jgi:hypothetical protein
VGGRWSQCKVERNERHGATSKRKEASEAGCKRLEARGKRQERQEARETRGKRDKRVDRDEKCSGLSKREVVTV